MEDLGSGGDLGKDRTKVKDEEEHERQEKWENVEHKMDEIKIKYYEKWREKVLCRHSGMNRFLLIFKQAWNSLAAKQ